MLLFAHVYLRSLCTNRQLVFLQRSFLFIWFHLHFWSVDNIIIFTFMNCVLIFLKQIMRKKYCFWNALNSRKHIGHDPKSCFSTHSGIFNSSPLSCPRNPRPQCLITNGFWNSPQFLKEICWCSMEDKVIQVQTSLGHMKLVMWFFWIQDKISYNP